MRDHERLEAGNLIAVLYLGPETKTDSAYVLDFRAIWTCLHQICDTIGDKTQMQLVVYSSDRLTLDWSQLGPWNAECRCKICRAKLWISQCMCFELTLVPWSSKPSIQRSFTRLKRFQRASVGANMTWSPQDTSDSNVSLVRPARA